MPLGVDFRKHLADSVGQCQLLLAVIGKGWLRSDKHAEERCLDSPGDFVRIELETAFQRKIPVVPLLVQGATMPQEEELPESLRALAYYNAIRGVEAHLTAFEKGI
jgi:hypothetical protein